MCDVYYYCLLLKSINNLFLALIKGKRQMLGMIYILVYIYIYSFIPVFCMLVILFDFHPSSKSISHKYDMIYANPIKHRNILICKKHFDMQKGIHIFMDRWQGEVSHYAREESSAGRRKVSTCMRTSPEHAWLRTRQMVKDYMVNICLSRAHVGV